MEAKEIKRIIWGDPILSKGVVGVYAADRLPHRIDRDTPYGVISNTETFGQGGQHWVAMVVEGEQGEFFDSFGRSPEQFGQFFVQFLRERCASVWFNARELQSRESTVCGHYCLYYLAHRLSGGGVDVRLSPDKSYNDYVVEQYVNCMSQL